MTQSPDLTLSRRTFLGSSAAATLATAISAGAPSIIQAADASKTLKIALIGCGGRGTGAASQALKADMNINLVAMADIAPDQIEKSLEALKKVEGIGDKVKVEESHKFVGLDGIDKVLAPTSMSCFSPRLPASAPSTLKKRSLAGKHAFCEKPVAVDAPGVRRFLAAADEVEEEATSACNPASAGAPSTAERETQKRIHEGMIGDVRATYGTYLGNTPWVKQRQPGWTDLEYQLRNWLYFTWLSGDHLVEQAIHTVDKMCWAFNDVDPVSATGTGGRQQRIEDQYGHIYDHFAVQYEYPGRRARLHLLPPAAGLLQ